MKAPVLSGRRAGPALGKHFYQFYKGPEDLFRAVTPFLRIGLENKEACLWIVSRAVGILEAVETLQREYDLIPFLQRGQLLVLPAEQWYLDRGRFSERKTWGKFKRFLQEKERAGFSVFRAVGDIGWLEEKDWMKFQSYEKEIHEWFQEIRGIALCAYPIHKCSMTQTKDILDHHDSVFLTKL